MEVWNVLTEEISLIPSPAANLYLVLLWRTELFSAGYTLVPDTLHLIPLGESATGLVAARSNLPSVVPQLSTLSANFR